ncbi:hypothetical protein ACOSQ4_010222 [Xanthoceras sorbifolium]
MRSTTTTKFRIQSFHCSIAGKFSNLKNESLHLQKSLFNIFQQFYTTFPTTTCILHLSLLFFSSSSSSRFHTTTTKTKTKVSLQDYLLNQQHFSPEAASKASSIKTHLKLSFLRQTGFSNTHIENLIQKALAFLSCKLDNTIKPKIKIFQDLGFSSSDIANLMSTNPWNFRRSADALEQSVLVLKSILGSNAGVSKLLGVSD